MNKAEVERRLKACGWHIAQKPTTKARLCAGGICWYVAAEKLGPDGRETDYYAVYRYGLRREALAALVTRIEAMEAKP